MEDRILPPNQVGGVWLSSKKAGGERLSLKQMGGLPPTLVGVDPPPIYLSTICRGLDSMFHYTDKYVL